jgi:hypothetical protein
MPSGTKVAATAALILAFIAPGAVAQEDGVFVDPDSPAGKEYVLPIDQARRDATGAGGRSPVTGRPTPAFGEGVRPDRRPDRAADPRGGTQGGTQGSTAREAKSAPTIASAQSALTVASARRARERDGIDRALTKASVGGDGGESEGSLVLLVGGVVVMVLGVGAGLFLRRRTT